MTRYSDATDNATMTAVIFRNYFKALQFHPLEHLFDGTLTAHDDTSCEWCPKRRYS